MLNTIALVLAVDGKLSVNTATSSALGVAYENEATTVTIDISAVSSIASYTHRVEIMVANGERHFIDATITGTTITAKIPNSCIAVDGYALLQLRSENSSGVVVKSHPLKFYVEKGINAYDKGTNTDAWVIQIESRISKLEGQVALLIAEAMDLNSWEDVQLIIRSGLGEDFFPEGTEITLHKESSLVIGSIGNALNPQGITSASITDHEKFLDAVGTSETAEYEFYFDGVNWQFDALSGHPVDLSEYGLAVAGVAVQGDEFTVHETAAEIPFVVLAHGKRDNNGNVIKATSSIVPSNPNIKNWAVLASKPCVKNQSFGVGWGCSAAFYVHTAMPAGTYYFHGYQMCTNNGSTAFDGIYEFTISSPIPAGGSIEIALGAWWSDSSSPIGNTITTRNASMDVIQNSVSLSLVGASSGTDLGYLSYEYQSNQAAYPAYSAYTYSNTIRRMFVSSNDYAVSLIREYINADAKAGTWYQRKDPFAIIKPSDANYDGFLYGADHGFKTSLLEANCNYYETDFDYYTNGVVASGVPIVHALVTGETGHDGRKLSVKNDKVFLLSIAEVGFGNQWEDGTAGNDALTFYQGAGNIDRIKFLNGAARYWWLRCENPWGSIYAAIVLTDGSLGNDYASHADGCVPACIIG